MAAACRMGEGAAPTEPPVPETPVQGQGEFRKLPPRGQGWGCPARPGPPLQFSPTSFSHILASLSFSFPCCPLCSLLQPHQQLTGGPEPHPCLSPLCLCSDAHSARCKGERAPQANTCLFTRHPLHRHLLTGVETDRDGCLFYAIQDLQVQGVLLSSVSQTPSD